ncbi:MAG: hypothetical protein HC834_01450 [Rhodospirillales bacterium]|nr:hypothetical protein [Rhodospirillales bacterium]
MSNEDLHRSDSERATARSLPALPGHLAERVRRLNARDFGKTGDYVLYWMQTACRGHENPALDVALHLATHLDRPVIVAASLCSDGAYSSDRHHTFWLQGIVDAFTELHRRGIATVLHVAQLGHNVSAIEDLARGASVVVSEDMPVSPWRGRSQSLADETAVALWVVDTACIVPMRLTQRAFDRAYLYRDATRALRMQRLTRTWPEVSPVHEPKSLFNLPFVPVDWQHLDLAATVAGCAIDHGIGPVAHTRGGSSAGYARWSDFRDNRLRQYARRRINALDQDGVSRMSPYLHLGQVSPFRIAREAAKQGSDGSRKFLDELLIWRELSYAWCFHQPDHDTANALPAWARQTLADHAKDVDRSSIRGRR